MLQSGGSPCFPHFMASRCIHATRTCPGRGAHCGQCRPGPTSAPSSESALLPLPTAPWAPPCGHVLTSPSRACPITNSSLALEQGLRPAAGRAAVQGLEGTRWGFLLPSRGPGMWGQAVWLDWPVGSWARSPFWWAAGQLGGCQALGPGILCTPQASPGERR